MYYDRDDNIDNINVPDKFVEITTLLTYAKQKCNIQFYCTVQDIVYVLCLTVKCPIPYSSGQ